MRILFNTAFEEGTRSIARAAEELAAAERQVSSGRRVGVPSEDPLGTASAIAEHATVDRLDAYGSAAGAASYRLGLADSVLSDIVIQIQAAQTTALSAQGSPKAQAQRDAAANELLAIRDAVLSDADTQFQGTYLFSGSKVTTAPFVKTVGGISAYQGDASPTSIDIAAGRSVQSTFDGGQILQGSDSQHVLDVLTNLAAAVSAGDNTAISTGLDALTRAFDRATKAQAQVGNGLRSLDDNQTQLTATRTQVVTSLSKIEDADLAKASTRLAQAETAYRAALGAMATLGRLSLMDYLK